MNQKTTFYLKSLQLQIFNKIFDTNINKTISILELINYVKSDLLLVGKTKKYRNILAPDDAEKFKENQFKEISLIQYRTKKSLETSFNKAYGLIVDIDKKDNLNIDLKALFNKIKQDDIFNIGFISLNGGIKLIRFFDKTVNNIELLQGLKSVYYDKLASKYNIKIDKIAYKHTLLTSSNELFYNLNHTLNTDYWIKEHKRDIAKKEKYIKDSIGLDIPNKDDPPNLIQACDYLRNIKLSYQDWISCCFGLANSFPGGGLRYWNIICNNPFYIKPKHEQENIRIWNNAINKGKSQSSFTTVIKIAMNNGFVINRGKNE